MKHRKGEKIMFCEEEEEENVSKRNSNDLVMSLEKNSNEIEVISPSKQIGNAKEKKKKKKKFI